MKTQSFYHMITTNAEGNCSTTSDSKILLNNLLRSGAPSRGVHPNFPHGISTRRSEITPFLDTTEYRSELKCWWRDVANRSAMEEGFQKFLEPIQVNIDDQIYMEAWNRVEKKFLSIFTEKLKVLGVGEASNRIPTNTSPGYPFTRAGIHKKHLAMPVAKQYVRKQWRRVSTKKPVLFFPVLSGARRVVRIKPKNRPRLVWLYPLTSTLIESQFSVPILEHISRVKPPWLGSSINWLDNGRSFERLRAASGLLYSSDFSNFDTRVLSRYIRSAFLIIKKAFDMTEVEDGMFEEMTDYFIHTPINMYGTIKYKHRGVPSGSNWTQLVDTLVNMFYSYYAESACEGRPVSFTISDQSVWLGDDGDVNFSYYPPEDEMDIIYFDVIKDLGPLFSKDKCVRYFSKTTRRVILSRTLLTVEPYIQFDGNKLVAQIFIPEKPDKVPGHTLARLMGLVWAFGFNKFWYGKLTELKDELLDKYQDIEPTFKDEELKYLLGTDVPLTWPGYYELRMRYFGYV